jgi:hypothetical protein
LAEALIAAVAPVKIRVGGWGGLEEVDWRRSGSMAWEKMKAAFLPGVKDMLWVVCKGEGTLGIPNGFGMRRGGIRGRDP